jgi:hypothetical protein
MAHKIVGLPDRFRPASGRVLSLREVPAKHTEVLFVTTRRGDEFRIEAEIDARYDEGTDWSEEFQVGSYNVFRDDRRDKRVELSTIDPERQEINSSHKCGILTSLLQASGLYASSYHRQHGRDPGQLQKGVREVD